MVDFQIIAKVIPRENNKILEIKLNNFKNSIERVTTVSSDRKEGLKMLISKKIYYNLLLIILIVVKVLKILMQSLTQIAIKYKL